VRGFIIMTIYIEMVMNIKEPMILGKVPWGLNVKGVFTV